MMFWIYSFITLYFNFLKLKLSADQNAYVVHFTNLDSSLQNLYTMTLTVPNKKNITRSKGILEPKTNFFYEK